MMLPLLGNIRHMFNVVPVNNYTHLAVLSLVLLISALWYYFHVYKPFAKIPACRLEHRIPYWTLKRSPINYEIMKIIVEQAKRYESEGVFALWMGVPILIAYGEEVVKKIINEPSATDKPGFYKYFEYAIGAGILTSNGEVWKKQWKMAAPAFQVSAVKSYIPTMNRHSEEMVRKLFELDSQPTDDIINILAFCTFGMLDETNFGNEERSWEEYTHIVMVLKETTAFMIKRVWCPWLSFDFALQMFPSARKAHGLITNLLEYNMKPRLVSIKESMTSRPALPDASVSDCELDGKKLKPIGQVYVEHHLKDPTITMDEITRQISFLVGAGFDTSTHALKFALLLLGQHRDVQDRAFEEVMSETEGHVTYDDLQRLTYLECVIKESLRLFPTAPLFGRHLNKALQCGEIELPKNTNLWVNSYLLHRNPNIYPNPEKFDPERFMDKDSKIRPWNYIPFAEGARQCIGKYYALVQMKIVLAHVLRNFIIISHDRMEDVELSWEVVLQCTKKLRMQFLPRTLANQSF